MPKQEKKKEIQIYKLKKKTVKCETAPAKAEIKNKQQFFS